MCNPVNKQTTVEKTRPTFLFFLRFCMFIYVYACVCVLMLVGRPEFDGLASLVALRAVLHFTVLRQINLYLSIYLSLSLSLSLALSP